MSLTLSDRRIWGLFAIVLLTTTSIIALRMLGLYEGFDAASADVADPAAPQPKRDAHLAH